LSVKSEGDFADILADGDPAIWTSNRPAQSGDAGKLFQAIIARALALRAERDGTAEAKPKAPARAARKKPAARKATTKKR
jgi:hypothetical protein